ncbi:MAG: hypothetical protein ACKOHK_14270, partial [Planctomycetia bacterium]
MDKQMPVNSLAIVGVVFGTLLLGMLLLEVVHPVRKQAEVPAAPAVPNRRADAAAAIALGHTHSGPMRVGRVPWA